MVKFRLLKNTHTHTHVTVETVYVYARIHLFEISHPANNSAIQTNHFFSWTNSLYNVCMRVYIIRQNRLKMNGIKHQIDVAHGSEWYRRRHSYIDLAIQMKYAFRMEKLMCMCLCVRVCISRVTQLHCHTNRVCLYNKFSLVSNGAFFYIKMEMITFYVSQSAECVYTYIYTHTSA